MASPDEILEYWFGPDGSPPDARSDLWWGNVDDQDAVDREIERRFGEDVERAMNGELEPWRDQPESCLAYVLLLDQFPRHIYRGTPRAFAGGDRAVDATLRAVDRGLDRRLDVPERIFLYMPLMHAEDRALQQRSIELFDTLVDDAPEATRSMAAGSFRHAREHAEPIARFGRFPHRNAALDRESTDAEHEWLETLDRDYGQSPT